jgi:glutamate-1-semialdehyde aminotransferase
MLTGTDANMIPTDKELQGLFKKIGNFFLQLIKIFEDIIAGFKLDYGAYESYYGLGADDSEDE